VEKENPENPPPPPPQQKKKEVKRYITNILFHLSHLFVATPAKEQEVIESISTPACVASTFA